MTQIIDINLDLFQTPFEFAEKDKFAAPDQTVGIEKNEIRGLADHALGIAAFDKLAVQSVSLWVAK